MAAAAAIVAYLPTQALGLKEGFWSAITALAVVQTEFGAVRSTARDQVLGAVIGGLVGLAVLSTLGQGLPAYAVAVVVAMLACWGANVASAARLAGVTATILILVPHAGSAQRMLVSRVFEVGWGITVALAVVWAGTWLREMIENEISSSPLAAKAGPQTPQTIASPALSSDRDRKALEEANARPS